MRYTPVQRPFKKRLQWSEQAMLDAMKAVQDGSPITTAARVHGVPKTSLHNRSRIKGKVIRGVKSGPKQYLSAEEETESHIFDKYILVLCHLIHQHLTQLTY